MSSEKLAHEACARMSQHELNQALFDVVERNEYAYWFGLQKTFDKSTAPAHENLVSDDKL